MSRLGNRGREGSQRPQQIRGQPESVSIVESSCDAIIGMTPQGIVTSWNPAATRIYGYAAREMVGRAVGVLYPPEHQAEEAEVLRHIVAGGDVGQVTADRIGQDGALVPVSLTISPIMNATGTIVGAATISRRLSDRGNRRENSRTAGSPERRGSPEMRDQFETRLQAEGQRRETQRQEAQLSGSHTEAQLQQAQRLENLGQLAGGVAHDFNNLLAVILNYASFVSEELAAATGSDCAEHCQTARADIAQIQRAAERAAALTHQLLAFARREVVRPQVLDLNHVITAVEEMLRRTLGEHVELVISLADGLWPVLADPGQLEQVLVNLAVNARDAMPGGGTLTIETGNVTVDADAVAGGSTARQGHNVRLRVSDTGTGMAADVAEHAFEPFFTTKAEGTGTGLGLATVYGILAQGDGQIRIYSEAGSGTTFSITLPVTDQAIVPIPAAATYRRTPEGETVLIVEDEEALRAVTERIFARNGYRVITAASGPAALDLARHHDGEIHLLVTDVVMPHMLGKEVADKMRAVKPGIEVLYMSGYARPVLASQGRLDPGVALVEKPFSEADLMTMAGRVLNGHFRGFTTTRHPASPA